jgi:hypothetical protein
MSLAGSAQYGSAYLAAVEFLSPRQAHAPLAIARIARNPSDDVIALGDDYGE